MEGLGEKVSERKTVGEEEEGGVSGRNMPLINSSATILVSHDWVAIKKRLSQFVKVNDSMAHQHSGAGRHASACRISR